MNAYNLTTYTSCTLKYWLCVRPRVTLIFTLPPYYSQWCIAREIKLGVLYHHLCCRCCLYLPHVSINNNLTYNIKIYMNKYIRAAHTCSMDIKYGCMLCDLFECSLSGHMKIIGAQMLGTQRVHTLTSA